MDNAFRRVKSAIVSRAEEVVRELGIKHLRDSVSMTAQWTDGFLCPFCGDRSGSGSMTRELFLKCHQCSIKLDVFSWVAKRDGKQPWQVMRELGDRLQVPTDSSPRATRSFRSMPSRMSEDILSIAQRALWESPDASGARAMLAERKLDDQVLLTELGLGYVKGWVVFSQRDEHGGLRDRYRAWNPAAKIKWMWYGSGSGGPGIWPALKPQDGDKILLCEGESDVMAAMTRLRLHEQGWHVCTWTAGATSCPKPSDIPREFYGREIHICYDNDVFQGPNYQEYFVEAKPGKDINNVRAALMQRLRNLLTKVAPLFESLGCRVVIRECPVDPRKKWGGDMRDWISEGGHNLDDWKAYPFDQLPEFGKMVQEVPFASVFTELHKPIRTVAQVEAIARDDVTISKIYQMNCEIGQHPSCTICPGARLFPDGMVDMSNYQRELTVGLEVEDVSRNIIEHVIQKPKGCPRVEVIPLKVHVGSEWRAMASGKAEDTTQRSLHIFSLDAPSLSGEVQIEGTVFPNERGNGVVMLAETVKSLERTDVDLVPVINDYLQHTPAFSDRIEDIDDYLTERSNDLAANVTKIYGRRDIHIAHDLLMHSARRANLSGSRQRAWLDICVFGDTRTGKSLTFRRMFEHHGLGLHSTAVSNISRAGLVMGADKQGMLKPGLFPRSTGKALMLDEMHFLVQNSPHEHPMSWLQSARDDGVVSGVKIYGNRDLPAEVRFVTIANWMRNRRRAYEFSCEHLMALYGSPETLARLDFGLSVEGKPTQNHLDQSAHWWNKERTRMLILRAWAQDCDQVVIDDDAHQHAKDRCEQWVGVYDSEHLPLFTPEEKPNSILRIAISLANICFSHPKKDPYSVHVRKVHVEWAARWLEYCWKQSGYDRFSGKRIEAQEVVKPYEAEKYLTVKLYLQDPALAESVLSQLLTPFSASEVASITGLEFMESNKWISKMVGLRVFERTRASNGYNVLFCLTRGGDRLIHNLMRAAQEDEKNWTNRYNTMLSWVVGDNPPGNMLPMNSEPWELFGDNPDGQAVPF